MVLANLVLDSDYRIYMARPNSDESSSHLGYFVALNRKAKQSDHFHHAVHIVSPPRVGLFLHGLS